MYDSKSELKKGIISLEIEGLSVNESEKRMVEGFIENNFDSEDLIRELTKYYKSYTLGLDPSTMNSLINAYTDLVNDGCIDDLQECFAEEKKPIKKLPKKIVAMLNPLIYTPDVSIIIEIAEEYRRSVKIYDPTNLSQLEIYYKVISEMMNKYVR